MEGCGGTKRDARRPLLPSRGLQARSESARTSPGCMLTMAFTGVFAANLGAGSKTIVSVFHALEDLAGERLDALVDELTPVKLLVINEVSTYGAVAFEVISRRMQQVAWVLWRRCFRCALPVDMGPFGGAGVLLMGDFAQLPPLLSMRSMAGMPVIESGGAMPSVWH